MTNVLSLQTRSKRNAASNREALIDEARNDSAAFGADLDFDALAWDVTSSCPKPAGKAGQKAVLYFATHENGCAKTAEGRTPLPEPLGAVIKALVRKKKDANPKLGVDQFGRFINASRYLAPLLEDRGNDPCRLLPQDLDEACEAIAARCAPTTRYRIGQQLEELVRELSRWRMLAFEFQWYNPFPRITNAIRIGPHAEKCGFKIVEEEVLDELARLSHIVTSDSDKMLMAAIKLLLCAPWRVGEVNTLPDDAWVERPVIGPDGPLINEDGSPCVRYGIRYWPEKSTKPDIKWIASIMVPVARSAIQTLLEISKSARELARWYEDHLGRAWLPGQDKGPEQRFSLMELHKMFGLSSKDATKVWLERRSVPIETSGQTELVRRKDLEFALLREWAKLAYLGKDRRNLKVSRHLFLTHANLHHSLFGTNPCMIGMTTDQHISDFLSGRGQPPEKRKVKRQGEVRSVFKRFGSVALDGSELSCNSHEFRHWINDLAQRGSMSQVLIARWSGRSEIAQNSEYDHMSGIELAEMGRSLLVDGKVKGVIADIYQQLPPINRETFRESVFETGHITALGACDHNFFSAPCPEHSCATCESSYVIKGDQAARQRTMAELEDTEWLLERAIEEMEDETEGASNFVEAHSLRVEALRRIIAVHDDESIADGTWVRVNTESPPQFEGKSLRGSDA